MDILITAAQFLLGLSILIVLHEAGHFLPAKLFGTRVEKFYLFFDYKFSLFKKKIGGTEYGIGWIPLGGYVKISGMIDESMDKEQMKGEPQPWEFRSKPAWQRLIVMVGGVVVNLVVGFVIYSGSLAYWGEEKLPVSNLEYGLSCSDTLTLNMGMQDGDVITKIEDQEVKYYGDMLINIILEEAEKMTVLRDGKEIELEIPYHFNKTILHMKKARMRFAYPRYAFFVDSITRLGDSINQNIQLGDQIVGFNGVETFSQVEFKRELGNLKDQPIDLYVLREGKRDTIEAMLDTNGNLGVVGKMSEKNGLQFEKLEYTMGEAIPAAWNKSVNMVVMYAKQMPLMFSAKSEGYKSMGGFLTMAKTYGTDGNWNWQRFWDRTAMISLVLAFMNILPIPALDGGHVVFLLYEIVTGKEAPQKVLEYAQMVGFVILISLLLFANGNDIFRTFFG